MAEDHGLGDGDGAVDVTESPELLISVIAQNIILLDGVQGLLLALQLDNVWEHLAPHCPCVPSVPLNADALVLVALGGNHHISLIQHKHLDLLGIYEFQFGTPVQHGAGCADDDLLRDLLPSLHCRERRKGCSRVAVQTGNALALSEPAISPPDCSGAPEEHHSLIPVCGVSPYSRLLPRTA
uniref:Uncharacterized protein n=1 Tax=Zosterops lateralis melanops TaxID=1220523 RepID=A0A8D2P2B5_ZOSLA